MRLRGRASRSDKPPVDDKDNHAEPDQKRNKSGPTVKVIPIAGVPIRDGDHSAEDQSGPDGCDIRVRTNEHRRQPKRGGEEEELEIRTSSFIERIKLLVQPLLHCPGFILGGLGTFWSCHAAVHTNHDAIFNMRERSNETHSIMDQHRKRIAMLIVTAN
jgi:hypothetical protein